MTFVQATTGSGGWPMSVWLTPELKPFFGGTYFPPTSRWGTPGLRRHARRDRAGLAARIARKVDAAAAELLERLKSVTGADGQAAASRRVAGAGRARRRRRAVPAGVRSAARRLRRRAEVSAALASCCSCCASTPAHRRRRAGAAEMATETLRAMALGGMRDHIGGGFHRYSVDARLARAAFREDALRPGAARARVPRGGAGDRRRVLRRRSPRTRCATSCAR